MSLSGDHKHDAVSLRLDAERQLANAVVAPQPASHPAEDLLHELQVHQVELEMQNEALRQKQTELEAMRDRYVDLHEFAPVGYLTLTADGMIDEINFTATTLLGVERKKLLQRRFAALVVADDQNRWRTLFMRLMEQGGKGSVELALQRGDGTVFSVQLNCATRKVGADGTALRISLTDLTERKSIENALRESERLAHAALDALDDSIAILDESGTITAVNRAWRRFAEDSGSEAERVPKGTNYLAVCDSAGEADAEGAGQMATGIRSVINGVRSEFKLEYPCDTPTQRRWFLCRVSRFQTDGAVRVLVAHLDITRAKEAENQRQRELLRWNSILKASSDGIHVIDADGLLLDANQAFLTMLGLDRSAIGTLRVTDWDVHADWAVIRERLSMLIESDTPTTIETRHRCSDGRIINVEISICCVRSEGQPFIYSASRDITARKQTEATLSRYQHHLEELVAERTLELKTLANQLLITEVRERSLLAAELHDDLGQNLALAKHKLGLFGEPGKNGASVDYLPAMKEVELLIDRANASVRSFSTQLSPLALTQFGLVAALESLAEDFLRVWGLSVRLHLCNTVTLHEPMAAILFRIVRELLINVLKHARVSEAELIMVLDADSGVLEITVADNGIGFDVKQKFTAVPDSGYGLGSIRQRIGFMGGTMSIDSEVGNGTIVSLTLTPEPVRPQ